MLKSSWSINPFMPNGISNRYQLEQSVSVLRDVGYSLVLIQVLIEHSASKLFVYALQKGR